MQERIKTLWKTPLGKVGIGLGSVAFLCSLCLIFSALLPPATPASPGLSAEDIQNTAIALAWQSFTQTAAALPTQTFTPAPTSTPVPTPTQDIYRIELAARFSRYNEAFQAFATQSTLMANDPNLITDQAWIVNTAVTLVQLDAAATEIETIPGVNAKYEKLDGYMKAIAQETHLLVSNYTSGIDNRDLNALYRATANIELITQYTRLAVEEINKIK